MNVPAMPTPHNAFTVDALQVKVYATPDDLALAAAMEARQALREALAARGTAAAILASATSQIKFLDCLAAGNGVDWAKITLFHLDEYLGLAADHPASFRRFLRQHAAEKLRPRYFHYLEGDALQPLEECERYGRLLKAQPIDLCCLGIGENGHVAFNDPSVADFTDPRVVKIVKLDLKCRMQQVGEGLFPHLPAVPQYALTLTIPELCSAKRMLCVVPEKRKAQAVKDALHGPIQTHCPASVLRKQPHATLFLDVDSASLL
jgi:glucosamine-6-phosphate deaminase